MATKKTKKIVKKLDGKKEEVVPSTLEEMLDTPDPLNVPEVVNTTPVVNTKRVLIVDSAFDYRLDYKRSISSIYFNNDYLTADYYDFFQLKDDEGVPYLLSIIELLEKSALNPKEFYYDDFQEICNKWFNHAVSLEPTDIICTNPFDIDTSHIVLWLWGYFVMGKKINWLCRRYNTFFNDKELRDVSLGMGQSYLADSIQYIKRGFYNRNIFENNSFILLGCMNAMLDNKLDESMEGLFKDNQWTCDLMPLDSHIVGGFGIYNRKPNSKTKLETLRTINGLETFGAHRLKYYKNYISNNLGIK